MYHLIQFLLAHGYLVLFGFVLAEQIGLPIPAVPILLAMDTERLPSTSAHSSRCISP